MGALRLKAASLFPVIKSYIHTNTQLIFIIHRLYICEFACLLKCIRNPQTILMIHLLSFVIMLEMVKNLSHLIHIFSVFLFQLCKQVLVSYCKQMYFCGLFNGMVLAFQCLLLMISLFKMQLRIQAEELCNIPKYKKTVMCLMQKICVR